MARGTDGGGRSARSSIEQILDWLAGEDGAAFLVEPAGECIVRGDPRLAASAVELIEGSLELDDGPSVGEAAVTWLKERRAIRRWTLPLPFAWVLGLLVPDTLDHRDRLHRAGRIIGRSIRPKTGAPLPPASGSGGTGAPALLGLSVRRRPN